MCDNIDLLEDQTNQTNVPRKLTIDKWNPSFYLYYIGVQCTHVCTRHSMQSKPKLVYVSALSFRALHNIKTTMMTLFLIFQLHVTNYMSHLTSNTLYNNRNHIKIVQINDHWLPKTKGRLTWPNTQQNYTGTLLFPFFNIECDARKQAHWSYRSTSCAKFDGFLVSAPLLSDSWGNKTLKTA